MAAAWWAGDRPKPPANYVNDALAADLIKAGYSQESVFAYQQSQKPADAFFEVWEENWKAVIFFLDLQTQWQSTITFEGRLVRFGIPSNCIESEMNMNHTPKSQRKTLLQDVRLMERAALDFFSQDKG